MQLWIINRKGSGSKTVQNYQKGPKKTKHVEESIQFLHVSNIYRYQKCHPMHSSFCSRHNTLRLVTEKFRPVDTCLRGSQTHSSWTWRRILLFETNFWLAHVHFKPILLPFFLTKNAVGNLRKNGTFFNQNCSNFVKKCIRNNIFIFDPTFFLNWKNAVTFFERKVPFYQAKIALIL